MKLSVLLGTSILWIAYLQNLVFSPLIQIFLICFKHIVVKINSLASIDIYTVLKWLSGKCSCFCLVAFTLLYSQFSLADAPSVEDIKPEVIAKLPPHFELKDLSYKEIKNVGNALMPVYRGSVALETTLKEPLYTIEGYENGIVQLRKVVEAGTPMVRSATVMAMSIAGAASEYQVTVIFDYDRKDKKQSPLSSFRKGTYTIVSEQVAAANTPSQSSPGDPKGSTDEKKQTLPWEKRVAPENLLQLSQTLWDISTGELLDENWVADSIRPIQEIQGKYWPTENSKSSGVPGFAPKLLVPFGSAPIKPIPEVRNGQLLTSTNHQQFVELKQGDLWISTVNWQDSSVSDSKNLTNSGEFDQYQLLAWYGNEVYLYTRKQIEKPVTRVNTDTGATESLAYSRALQGQHSSPDRRFRVNHGESDMLLHVYDFATHEEFTLDGYHAFRRQGIVSKDHKAGVAIEPDFWVSNTEFFNMSAWYDLEKREHKLITDFPEFLKKFPRNVSVRNVTLVPGGDFIDISIEGYEEFSNQRQQKGPIRQRYRIHRQTDEITELPAMPSAGWNKDAVWVDSERYLFYRSEGAPEEKGLWLFDIPSQRSTLISDLVPNQRLQAKNVQSSNLEQIEGFKPAFKASPFLVITAHERVGFSTEVDGKFVFALISLQGKQPMYLDLSKKKINSRTATLFVNDLFTFNPAETAVETKPTKPELTEEVNEPVTSHNTVQSLRKPGSNGRSVEGFEANMFNRVPWDEQPEYFASFPFEKGDYGLAEDPSGMFRDLYIRTHQGKPLLGEVPNYDVFPRYDQRKQFVNAFRNHLKQSTDYYGLLCAIKEEKDEFTPEKIAYRDGYGNYYKSKSGFESYPVLTALAYSTIKPEHFGQYFCADPNDCGGDENKSRANSGINVYKIWGGIDASEAESQQALSRFLDNALPKLFAWADTLSCDVALSVPLHGSGNSATQSTNLSYLSNTLSMNSSDNAVSSADGNQFYAVVNASFTGADIGVGVPNTLRQIPGLLAYYLKLDTENISIYKNELLVEKVGTASSSKDVKIKVINGSIVK